MAQKREKEETELKVPETLTLCSPSIAGATSKISSSDEHRSSSPDRSDLQSTAVVDSRLTSGTSPKRPDLNQKQRSPTAESPAVSPAESPADDSNKVKRREINRCSGCRRKVGLMGFRCRCGEMFCSDHRYSDRHDCSYDYKAAGREAIARENPVVRAAKILKGIRHQALHKMIKCVVKEERMCDFDLKKRDDHCVLSSIVPLHRVRLVVL
ncbi:hypothetical protein QVD17_11308 [Tagetes erecta]|uniref:AN1-type domain-containing protein n=1 Tax=Tagetes erecta TaxID=13708 RepID=A0AAD8P212_TARER|nr:hypothetical protein QVD17_11308 [Tagetes erecta]